MACQILEVLGCQYETFDVLGDEKIRNGIKIYSKWPTIPQLYIEGEFIGGADIMTQLHKSGELETLISKSSQNTQ